ncbi:hypothetical protein MKZ38_005673 [Zalerion maritima]|uniref:Uncharacterized protein n=1 Tax=Zalerion maritima TaxID=339359 RepID=A0AAD5RW26_9PEZI|nr:hypothetical protein MKZ38_005673 [Zalerion maritima]
MSTTKILVLGPARGQLRSLFSKEAALQTAKNFDFAIIVGDLFGQSNDDEIEALLNGSIQVPLVTYFTVGASPLPSKIVERIVNGLEIAPNLQFLAKRCSIKTTNGIRIAVLGGLLDESKSGLSEDKHLPEHTVEDAKALKGFNYADILLTTSWPDQVWTRSEPPLDNAVLESIPKNPSLAELCTTLKPLYILAPSPGNFFFERTPFYYKFPIDSPGAATVCRFLSFAPFNNPDKAKALYAFSLPASKLSIEATTPSPFLAQQRKRRSPEADSYRTERGRQSDYWRPGGKSKRRRHSPGPQDCFLCLGNNTVGSHMVVSIGNVSYLATAKGPLPTSKTYSEHGMNYPAHMLVVPLEHGRSVATMNDDSTAVFKEMTQFRSSLQAMIASVSKQKLGSIAFEISLTNTVHVHWQFIPVPAEKVLKGLVEAAFQIEANNQKMGKTFVEPKPELADQMIPFDTQRPFFRIWLRAEEDGEGEDGGKIFSKTLVMDLTDVRFHFKYPRRVVAMLMEMEDRDEWQKCTQTEEEETEHAQQFGLAWKAWDFTMRDGYIQS